MGADTGGVRERGETRDRAGRGEAQRACALCRRARERRTRGGTGEEQQSERECRVQVRPQRGEKRRERDPAPRGWTLVCDEEAVEEQTQRDRAQIRAQLSEAVGGERGESDDSLRSRSRASGTRGRTSDQTSARIAATRATCSARSALNPAALAMPESARSASHDARAGGPAAAKRSGSSAEPWPVRSESAPEPEMPPEIVGKDRLTDGDEQQRARDCRRGMSHHRGRGAARGAHARRRRHRLNRAPEPSGTAIRRRRATTRIELDRPRRRLPELVGRREREVAVARIVVAPATAVDARSGTGRGSRCRLRARDPAVSLHRLLLFEFQRDQTELFRLEIGFGAVDLCSRLTARCTARSVDVVSRVLERGLDPQLPFEQSERERDAAAAGPDEAPELDLGACSLSGDALFRDVVVRIVRPGGANAPGAPVPARLRSKPKAAARST